MTECGCDPLDLVDQGVLVVLQLKHCPRHEGLVATRQVSLNPTQWTSDRPDIPANTLLLMAAEDVARRLGRVDLSVQLAQLWVDLLMDQGPPSAPR